jgi:peroxin-1
MPNCFVNLPLDLINVILSQHSSSVGRVLLRLDWEDQYTIVAWSGGRSSKPGHIEMSSEFIRMLGLDMQFPVNIEPLEPHKLVAIPLAQRVFVEPVSVDDWEIVELQAQYIEMNMLSQVAVVKEGQQIPIWIGRQTLVKLKIGETVPAGYVRLADDCEVIVAPKPRQKPAPPSEQAKSIKRRPKIFRIQDCFEWASHVDSLTLLVNDQTMKQYKWERDTIVILGGLHPTVKSSDKGKERKNDALLQNKAAFRVVPTNSIAEGHIKLPKVIASQLSLSAFSRVKVQPVDVGVCHPVENLMLFPLNVPVDMAQDKMVQAFKDWIASLKLNDYIPLLNGALLHINGANYIVYCNIKPEAFQSNAEDDQSANRMSASEILEELESFRQLFSVYSPSGVPSAPANGAPGGNQPQQRRRKIPVEEILQQLPKNQLYLLDQRKFQFNNATVKLMNPIQIDWPSDEDAVTLPSLDDIGGIEEHVNTLKDHIVMALENRLIKHQLGAASQGGIMVSGDHGSGKSLLVSAIGSYFKKHPKFLTNFGKLNFSELSGLRVETIRKRVGELFSEAIKKQPSIVFLDDVDILATNDQKETVSVGDPIRSRQIAEIIVDWTSVITNENHRVVCVMALQHAAAVNQLLLRPHVFGKQIQIQPPNLDARIIIMKKIMTRKGIESSSIDLQSIAINCEGYLGVDLEMLVERAVHVASTQLIEKSSIVDSTEELAKKLQHFLTHGSAEPNGLPNGNSHALAASTDSTHHNGDSLVNSVDGLANSRTGSSASASLAQSEASNKVSLSTNDLLEAQKGFTPASLKGIKLHKSSVSWQDIGGLEEVRSSLKQTLEWPSKYSFLFKNSPLRHRSGILLYGPPGCGKTMLAYAVAKECQLNFISVKGPELLNKYIGASEQSVRDMFSRAAAAKPCVLFFDEFDAIAPRRGHDNTGVTDRVVNQFLTQLDGVESLVGVYVLAATSRPDLIDPALLRPGRLDKSIYVNIPDAKERVQILQAQSRNLNMGPDVNLQDVAEWCEHYTGADLQAMLYNAQLEAIHRSIDLNYEAKLNAGQNNDKDEHELVTILQLDDNIKAMQHLSAELKTQMVKKVNTIKENMLDASVVGNKTARNKLQPMMTQNDLQKAYQGLVPSLSTAERRRYETIYANFMQSKGGDFSQQNQMPKKQTLA